MTDRQIGYIECIYLKEFRLKIYRVTTLRVALIYEIRRGGGRGRTVIFYVSAGDSLGCNISVQKVIMFFLCGYHESMQYILLKE